MPSKLGIALIGIQDSQFDPDALTFISTAGITDTFQRYAINDLVVGLKLNNLWAHFDAIYPMVGGTSTTHSYNLRNTSQYNLTFNGGWTHTSSGATPNGTNAFASTGYTYANATTNNTHISYYSRTQSTPNVGQSRFPVEIGNGTVPASPVIEYNLQISSDIAPNTALYSRQYSDPAQPGQINGQIFVANSISTGFFIGTRTSSTSHKAYKDGLQIGSTNTTANTYTLSGVHAIQLAKGVGGSYSNRQCAFASIGKGLTDSESLILNSLVQRFQNALGRAIVAVPTVQDLDAQNFLCAAAITDSTQAGAVQNLTAGLKYYGLWARMQAIYPLVGGTSTTHKFNLKSPYDADSSWRLVFQGGITQDSNGITPNGTNGYANTNYVPNTSGSQNDQHVSIYSRTNVAENSKDFGTQSAANNVLMLGIRTAAPDFFCSSGVNSSGDLALGLFAASTGLFCLSRIASGSYKIYRNGTSAKTVNNASAGRSINNLLFGANNNSGVIGEYSTRNYAFASVGLGLDDTQSANLYTVVQAYQTALSRQV